MIHVANMIEAKTIPDAIQYHVTADGVDVYIEGDVLPEIVFNEESTPQSCTRTQFHLALADINVPQGNLYDLAVAYVDQQRSAGNRAAVIMWSNDTYRSDDPLLMAAADALGLSSMLTQVFDLAFTK